jgi:hypothetical protein
VCEGECRVAEYESEKEKSGKMKRETLKTFIIIVSDYKQSLEVAM